MQQKHNFILILSMSLIWTACSPYRAENFAVAATTTSSASLGGPVNTSGGCKTMSSEECQAFAAVNRERRKTGLPALDLRSGCIAEAQAHAADMAQNNYFSHDGQGETAEQRFARFGLSLEGWGENIAYSTSPDLTSVVNNWMNSPGHRANILSQQFKSSGMGHAVRDGNHYWVQCFSNMAGD